MLNQAYNFLDNKNYEKAIEIFSEIIIQNPDDHEPYLGLARTYFRLGQYKKTKEFCEKAILLSPSDPMTHVVLAYSSYQLGASPEKCFLIAKTASELSPNSPEVVACLGWANMLMKKYKDAIVLLGKSSEFLPNNFEVRKNLLVSYSNLGIYKNAFVEAKNILKISPSIKTIFVILFLFLSTKYIFAFLFFFLGILVASSIILRISYFLILPIVFILLLFISTLYLSLRDSYKYLLGTVFFGFILFLMFILLDWIKL